MKTLLLFLISLPFIGIVIVAIALPYWFPVQGNENGYIGSILKHFCCDTAKNYYTVLSYVFGVLFGTFGLILGFFYYKKRMKFDTDLKEGEKKGIP